MLTSADTPYEDIQTCLTHKTFSFMYLLKDVLRLKGKRKRKEGIGNGTAMTKV